MFLSMFDHKNQITLAADPEHRDIIYGVVVAYMVAPFSIAYVNSAIHKIGIVIIK